MTTKTTPRLPIVGEFVRGVGRLLEVKVVSPPPPPPETFYVFEKISARAEVRMGHEVLKVLDTVWDYYGLESSVAQSIEDAKRYIAERDIGPLSPVEVVVVRVVSQETAELAERENLYAPGFRAFDSRPSRLVFAAPPVETVVWSSRNPGDAAL